MTQQLRSAARFYANPSYSGGKMKTPEPEHIARAKLDFIEIDESIARVFKRRKAIEADMTNLAKAIRTAMPSVDALFSSTRGVSDLTLAQLIGEGGINYVDGIGRGIERFETQGQLWKRYGVGLVDGERQRRIKKDKELAIRHGYNSSRHATVWNIGTNLIMKADPVYREKYKQQKAKEAAKDHIRPVVADARARRWLVKHFLRRFWNAYYRDLQAITAQDKQSAYRRRPSRPRRR
jgi:hypothetical protein